MTARIGQSLIFSVSTMVVASLMLALTIGLSKVAASASAPMLWFLALCMVASGLVLTVISWLRGELAGNLRPVVIFGVIAGALMGGQTTINFLSVAHVGAFFISLAFVLPVLTTYLLAVVIGMDRLHPLKVLSVAAGLAGGALLAAGKAGVSEGGDIGWILFALTNPVVIALGNVYRSRYWPAGASAGLLSAFMLLIGGIIFIPVAALFHGFGALQMLPETELFAIPALLVIMLFVAQYPAFLALQRRGGPVVLSLSGPCVALFGTLGAFLFLGEAAPPEFALAVILLLVGVLGFQYAQFRR